jgi:excisionase family DNA binding protein
MSEPQWADGKAMTIPEAAATLGISVDGVRKRIDRKTLHSYKDGQRRMVVVPYVEIERTTRNQDSPDIDLPTVPDATSTPAQLPALIESLVEPWTRRLSELEGDINKLTAENAKLHEQLSAARKELTALRRATIARIIVQVEAAQEALGAPESPPHGQSVGGG